MLVIERTYEAPIEKVWEALTNRIFTTALL